MSKPQTIVVPNDDRTRRVRIGLYAAERTRALQASEAVPYALSDAAAVFQLISEGLSTGHFARNDAGVISLTNICAVHFKALAENEGEHLLQLARRLKESADGDNHEELPK